MRGLKPCPFCGGEAKLTHKSDMLSFVECRKCGIQGSSFLKAFDRASDDAAIEAWNRRIEAPKYCEHYHVDCGQDQCWAEVPDKYADRKDAKPYIRDCPFYGDREKCEGK